MEQIEELLNRMRTFLSACPPGFAFPLGGDIKIPMPTEAELAQALIAQIPLSREQLGALRKEFTIRQAYSVAIFAVRMAVFAVRADSRQHLDLSFQSLIFDDGLVDWRDTLRALTLIEDCAKRLHVDLSSLLEKFRDSWGDRFKQTLHEGYLGRRPEERSLNTMGFTTSECADGLYYVNKE